MTPSTKKTATTKKPAKKGMNAEAKSVRPKKTPRTQATSKAKPVAAEPVAVAPVKAKEHPAISGIRIRLSAFDHRVLDEAAGKIIDTAQRSGAVVHGPVPLPTHIKKFTVNKSTFVHKNARDQYEMRIHHRLIDLSETTFKTMESLQSLSLPSGVDIEIKMQS